MGVHNLVLEDPLLSKQPPTMRQVTEPEVVGQITRLRRLKRVEAEAMGAGS